MKSNLLYTALLSVVLCLFHTNLLADDMREVNQKAEAEKQELFKKAAREKTEAQREAEKSRATILQNRSKLEQAIKKLKNQKINLEENIKALQLEKDTLVKEEKAVLQEISKTSQVINELVGVVRVNAKDIISMYDENLHSALDENYPDFLTALADDSNFPGMENISMLAEVLFQQITVSGEVKILSGSIIDRNGSVTDAEILVLGPFCATYRIDDEVGFLRYSSAGRNLYALSKLPPNSMRKQIHKYMDGETDSISMDIGRGAALQQLSHRLSLWEQVEEGGPIVWPILAIFILGFLIVGERTFFMLRKQFNSDVFMKKISDSIVRTDWQECEKLCEKFIRKPVARVILAGLKCRELERIDMENVLQEAILREIPPMERFLSTLGMLAAIAPLLGLLGTVTGMIDTFHIITLHGTSDPRLMSGGISEALVTTMLGLSVAIPLMLAQTLLNRSIEKEIGTMEEKGVALVNIIYKSRLT